MIVLAEPEIKAALQLLVSEPLTLRLWIDGDREISGAGYEPRALDVAGWSFSDEGASYPEQVWTFGWVEPEVLVFGYYLTNAAGKRRWAERFPDGPYMLRWQGTQIKVTPRLTLKAV